MSTNAALHAAAAFIARIAELELGEVRGFIHGWQRVVAADADRWFAAEAAVADAVLRSGRRAEQRVLLREMADTVTNAVWYRRSPPPERATRATEASGQYSATLAMIAVLVRDFLDPRDFAMVYAPFARLIPLETLSEP